MIDDVKKAMQYEGDIVEIGLGYGETTKQLLKVAKDNKRIVIGIDPFGDIDMPKSYIYDYGKFESNISDYKDYLELYKVNSLSEEAEECLKGRDISIAFVDGLQYKRAVLSDLYLVHKAKVIIVDDMNRMTGCSQVPQAVEQYIKETKRKLTIEGVWAIIK